MAKILYLTNDNYISGTQGGMGTKTRALKDAWTSKEGHQLLVSSVVDVQADVILIELLGINKKKKFPDLIEQLRAFGGPVLVYGSDSELLRWQGNRIESLSEVVNGWIANCLWQANYFNDFGLPVYGVLREPINCDLFRPGRIREDTVLAGGNISYAKHSDFFIALFEKLKDSETGYIGSAFGWNKKPDPLSLQLQHKMEDVVDTFHGQLPADKVADIMSTAKVFVVNSHYETCNRMAMEAHAAGLEIVAGPHICFDEWPNAHRFETLAECIEIINGLDATESRAMENVKFAKENWSYEASLEELNTIIGRAL